MDPATARAEALADAAIAAARPVLAGREFATYRCGAEVPPDVALLPAAERAAFRDAVRARIAAWVESLRPGCRPDALRPEVIVEAVPDRRAASVFVAPVFVAGRYRKLARGLSQTVFHCRSCRGRGGRRDRGCGACGSTGRVVAEAVEDFVVPPVLAAAGGTAAAFHGSGREDVDVRMLGAGRAFVVSVDMPRVRAPDLGPVPAAVAAASGGRVEVADLRVVGRDDMGRITSDHGPKSYRAVAEPSGAAEFPPDAAARLARLAGAEISQRTPQRVEDRRADLVRRRAVLSVELEESSPRRIVAVVRTDPGTYVKELVSGDGGRTEPSFASALGVPCACTELDVLGTGDGPVTSGTS